MPQDSVEPSRRDAQQPSRPDAPLQSRPDKNWWHSYYTPKRIRHQNLQLHLIKDLDISTVLEIGPAGGYVTALLANIGYRVITLDFIEKTFDFPSTQHIVADLMQDFPVIGEPVDLVVCCETLEHIDRKRAEQALHWFYDTGARYALVSVPYSGFMLYGEFMLTPHQGMATLFAKWLEAIRPYVPEAEPHGHKWELGTPGSSIEGWERAIESAGWRPIARRISAPTRSVFHLCERVPAWR